MNLNTHTHTHLDVRQTGARPRPVDEPAPTMLGEGLAKGVPVWRSNAMSNAAERRATEPAPTITAGHDSGERVWLRAGTNANDVRRAEDQPAPTPRYGNNGPEHKPHARLAWSIHPRRTARHDMWYVDLSVVVPDRYRERGDLLLSRCDEEHEALP